MRTQMSKEYKKEVHPLTRYLAIRRALDLATKMQPGRRRARHKAILFARMNNSIKECVEVGIPRHLLKFYASAQK
jgi:hypothetical protein